MSLKPTLPMGKAFNLIRLVEQITLQDLVDKNGYKKVASYTRFTSTKSCPITIRAWEQLCNNIGMPLSAMIKMAEALQKISNRNNCLGVNCRQTSHQSTMNTRTMQILRTVHSVPLLEIASITGVSKQAIHSREARPNGHKDYALFGLDAEMFNNLCCAVEFKEYDKIMEILTLTSYNGAKDDN